MILPKGVTVLITVAGEGTLVSLSVRKMGLLFKARPQNDLLFTTKGNTISEVLEKLDVFLEEYKE